MGPKHPDTLHALSELADAYAQAGGADKALVLHRELFELRRETLGPEHADTVMAMEMLARDYQALGQFDQAERLWREVLELTRGSGPENPRLLLRMRGLAGVIGAQGRYAEAEKLFREVLEIQKRVLGPEHPETLRTTGNWPTRFCSRDATRKRRSSFARCWRSRTACWARASRYAESITRSGQRDPAAGAARRKRRSSSRRCWTSRSRVLGPEHPETLHTMRDLANAIQQQGRPAEAEKLYPRRAGDPTWCSTRKTRGFVNVAWLVLCSLVWAGVRRQNLCFGSAWRSERRIPRTHAILSKSLLGECLSAQGKLQEAEPLLIDGYQGLKARAQTLAVPDRKRLLSDALQRLIAHCESASRPDEVTRWRAELEQLQSAEAGK